MRASPLLAYRTRHYKSFVDTSWIDIRPLSLVFGHNSSGKSALLSVLPMLRQTMEDPNPDVPFVFSSEVGVDLGVYEEVAHDHVVDLRSPIWFGLRITPRFINHSRFFFRRARSIGIEPDATYVLEVAVNYNKKRRRTAITDFRLSSLRPDDHTQSVPLLRLYRKTTAANQKWHIEIDPSHGITPDDISPAWTHFLPHILPLRRTGDEKSLALSQVLQGIHFILQEALDKVVHLGPSRAFPRRAYRITGESPRDVGILGENWPNLLMMAEERRDLLAEVNSWLAKLGYALRVEWGRQGYVHPILRDARTGIEVSLKDVGFGISQVLPILVQGFVSPPGTILILEQPEIHLHPRAQADLGDMLMAIAQRGVHLLVETHSEHLLLRIQRRVAESAGESNMKPSVDPNHVAIYYVEKARKETLVHRLSMDETGTFMDSPGEFLTFFSDDYYESLARAKALGTIKQRDIGESRR